MAVFGMVSLVAYIPEYRKMTVREAKAINMSLRQPVYLITQRSAILLMIEPTQTWNNSFQASCHKTSHIVFSGMTRPGWNGSVGPWTMAVSSSID
jgi:hypothetical protein